MSTFQPFAMERMMSKWENVVDYNLSESGVHPITARELVDDPAVVEELLTTKLGYAQANGISELREQITSLYPGAGPDNVLVTVGCAEANFNALQTLLRPGEEIVVMLPNYMQIWGVAQNLGAKVRAFHLKEDLGWAPDLDELNDVITEQTKLIAVCNPNNPTGHILTEAEMEAIVAVAERVGAWLLADEVYSGAERLSNTQTPSFWGRYDKVLATNSLSKAYRDCESGGWWGRRTWWMKSGLAMNTRRSVRPCSPTSSQRLHCLRRCAPACSSAPAATSAEAFPSWRNGWRAMRNSSP